VFIQEKRRSLKTEALEKLNELTKRPKRRRKRRRKKKKILTRDGTN
jgi:hypothetical protein